MPPWGDGGAGHSSASGLSASAPSDAGAEQSARDGGAADARFRRKLAKFDAADARFRALADALEGYRCAVSAVADAGVAVADALAEFFDHAQQQQVQAQMLQGHHAQGAAAAANGSAAGFGSGGGPSPSGALGVQNGNGYAVGLDGASEVSGSTVTAPGVAAGSSALSGVQPDVSGAFRAAQIAIKGKWSGDVMPRFDEEVYKAVKDSLDQFPEVRSYIKQRDTAKQEMARRQKKLKDTGTRVKDKQRKWRECSDRFKMFDDEVMQRFSVIDRGQPALVSKPLRVLVLLLDEFAGDVASSMHDVARLVSNPSPVAAITREFSPPPRHDAHTSGGVPAGRGEDEGWDDSFPGDDDAESAGAGKSAGKGAAGTKRGGADAAGGGSGHLRAQSALPPTARLVMSDSAMHTRRAASGPPHAAVAGSRGMTSPISELVDGIGGEGAVKGGQLTSRALQAVAAEGGDGPSPEASLPHSDNGREGAWDRDSRSERQNVLMRVLATFDFSPTETNELALKEGDVIEVYEKHSSGWWMGRTNHVTGYFPQNHSRPLTEEEEVEYVQERSRRRRDRRKGHRRKNSGLSASQSSLSATTAATPAGLPGT